MPICPTCEQACASDATACPVDGTLLSIADPLMGKVLDDRYRIVARLGEGGMGTVYRAEHIVLRKRMAVKVLRAELSADEDLVRRFQLEAVAASQIGQENIVDVTDFGRTPQGALYFVMEELEGQSLAAALAAHGPLSLDRALPILAQVCRALAAAHGRGIVHRDLKPDNVIVTRRADGTDFVKVVDFGISKSGGRPEKARLTRAGTIIGTPEYMSPEQGAAATVDHRADVYSFGVLAYELLTGTLPFQGESALATLLEHQTKAPEPPGRRRPGLPAELEALILKALEKRPESRQQTMAEVAAELTRVLTAHGLPPVYERPPTPPPQPGPVSGFTERFDAPQAPALVPRRSTGRGSTIALTSTMQALAEVAPARPRRRAAAAAAVGGLAALAVAAAVAAGVAWRGARRPGPALDAGSAAAPTTPRATVPATAPVGARERQPAGDPATAAPAVVTTLTAPAPGPAPTEAQAGRPRARGAPGAAASAGPAKAVQPAPARARNVGAARARGENPFRKLDDLKPDPF